MAEGLPKDGSIITLEKSTKNEALARKYWERAGKTNVIDLRIGHALDS